MSTRSITIIYEENDDRLLSMYKHFDGNIFHYGKRLINFLSKFKIVNGLPLQTLQTKKKVANGLGCLAAQLVSYFKVRPGDVYLIGTEYGHGEEYIYKIKSYNDQLYICAIDVFDEDDAYKTLHLQNSKSYYPVELIAYAYELYDKLHNKLNYKILYNFESRYIKFYINNNQFVKGTIDKFRSFKRQINNLLNSPTIQLKMEVK